MFQKKLRHAKSRQKRKNFRLFINFGEKRTKADITKGFYALSFHNGGFSGKLRFHGEILHKTHLTDNVFFGILMLFSGVFRMIVTGKGSTLMDEPPRRGNGQIFSFSAFSPTVPKFGSHNTVPFCRRSAVYRFCGKAPDIFPPLRIRTESCPIFYERY